MDLPFQALGNIELDANTVAEAMWSRDIDAPDEALITWWTPENRGAAIVKISPLNDTRFSLLPHSHYGIDDNGALRFGVKEPIDFRNYSATVTLTNASLNGQWSKSGNLKGKFNFDFGLPKPTVDPTTLNSWDEFKAWVGKNHLPEKYVTFRGHGSNKFNLSTTIQRANRARLDRFTFQTMQVFRGQAEAILQTRLPPDNGHNFSTLLGLAQHHGLPTPLLDLTASPYIAAYFAFADAVENLLTRDEHTHVRIFGLSREIHFDFASAYTSIAYYRPYISYLTVPPLFNQRLNAQQGRFLVTNILDLEKTLVDYGVAQNKPIIGAVDIPINCAYEALEDLHYMGVSAANLFPGLDGVCKMMKHSVNFKKSIFTL